MLVFRGIITALAGAAAVAAAATRPIVQASSCTSSVLHNRTPLTPYKNGVATKSYKPEQSAGGVVHIPFKVGLPQWMAKTIEVDITHVSIPRPPYDGVYWEIYYIDEYNITKGLDQGIFYSVEGKAPNRTVNFEWKLGVLGADKPGDVWHFGLQWYEDEPHIARHKYWNIPERRPRGFVEAEYYRQYYTTGLPRSFQTGDVWILSSPNYSDQLWYEGPRSACQYRGPPDD